MLLINNTNCFPLNINLNENINISNKNILDFLADGYCRYINVRGKNKGKCCGRRLKKNRSYCFEHNYNINKNNKKIQSKIIKKIEIDVYTSTTQLICYYNDKKEIKKIDHIKIRDKFIDSNSIGIKEVPKIPLLICFYNENTIFKDYIRKNKKRIKNKNKKKKQKLNKLKTKNVKLEYLDEGLDPFGFPKSNKIKSPFPNNKVIIKNKEYKCKYYTFLRIKKEITLYLIDQSNDKEVNIVLDYYEFEKILINIYNKDFVNEYFGFNSK